MKQFFLSIIVLLTTVAAAPGAVSAAETARTLKFFHTHTGRSLEVTYWTDGEYRAEALVQLNGFLSDWRNGERVEMDPALLDALHRIQRAVGSTGTFEVISAYRSPATNEMLRGRSGGVARKSQHLLGKAIDVRLTDVDTRRLRDKALELGLGGVGYYERSDFVHIDTGRVRRW